MHRGRDPVGRDAGRVVHLGGQQRGVPDVERVAEQADVAALGDGDAVVVHQPALEAGRVALAEQLGQQHGAQVAVEVADRVGHPPADGQGRRGGQRVLDDRRSGRRSAAARRSPGWAAPARAATGPNQRWTSRSVSATSRSPPMQRTALPGA